MVHGATGRRILASALLYPRFTAFCIRRPECVGWEAQHDHDGGCTSASGVYVVAFKHGGGVQAWSALKAGVRISSIVCFFVLFPFVPFFSTLLRINERTSKYITPSQVSQYLPHLLSL